MAGSGRKRARGGRKGGQNSRIRLDQPPQAAASDWISRPNESGRSAKVSRAKANSAHPMRGNHRAQYRSR